MAGPRITPRQFPSLSSDWSMPCTFFACFGGPATGWRPHCRQSPAVSCGRCMASIHQILPRPACMWRPRNPGGAIRERLQNCLIKARDNAGIATHYAPTLAQPHIPASYPHRSYTLVRSSPIGSSAALVAKSTVTTPDFGQPENAAPAITATIGETGNEVGVELRRAACSLGERRGSARTHAVRDRPPLRPGTR